MIAHMAEKAGDSVWRKVGEKAVITAVTTLLSEAIKASVELVKMSKLREQKAEFADRRAREKKADEPDEAQKSRSDDKPDEERDDELEEDIDDETDAADSDTKPVDDPPKGAGPRVDFSSYVASQRR